MNKSKKEITFENIDCIVCETEMVWCDDIREWICPKCGNRAFQTDDCGPDEIYFERTPDDDYEVYYDPEDMSPDKDGF